MIDIIFNAVALISIVGVMVVALETAFIDIPNIQQELEYISSCIREPYTSFPTLEKYLKDQNKFYLQYENGDRVGPYTVEELIEIYGKVS